jgi:hypothetical protein
MQMEVIYIFIYLYIYNHIIYLQTFNGNRGFCFILHCHWEKYGHSLIEVVVELCQRKHL